MRRAGHQPVRCGSILVEKRCKKLLLTKYPARVPAIFTNLKRENCGLYQGRPVALDYGSNMCFINAAQRLKKADWWSIKD